jgi:hypothetical protein
VVIPGLTLVSGGTFKRSADPWLSFALNGDLYQISEVDDAEPGPAITVVARSALLVSKSTNGGLTWGNPIPIIQHDTPDRYVAAKPSLTADPTDTNYVYVVWDQVSKLHPYVRAATLFTRSTDGGQTWEAPRTIYQSAQNDSNIGHQILVQPDGTLIDLFTEMNGQFQQPYRLIALRSTDRGATWSGPILAAQMQPIGGEFFADVAVDADNGNLFAVWADARFSAFQHNSIAFAMSTDGGLTWSVPIRINQTPDTIPVGSRNAFLPSIAVARDGTVAVTSFDFRNDTPAAGLSTDHWIIHAHPRDGLTHLESWHDEQRLTNASFDLEQAPVRFSGNFLGDYQGLAAAGNSFYALWAQPHGSDPASIFFRDPPPGESTDGPKIQAQHPEFPGVISRHGLPIRISDLGSTMLGRAFGHATGLDAHAAGWGWFVAPAPGDDSEVTTPGDQGEQHRMDLLTVLEHEVGHLPGQDHEGDSGMSEMLGLGTRPAFGSTADSSTFAADAPSALLTADGYIDLYADGR